MKLLFFLYQEIFWVEIFWEFINIHIFILFSPYSVGAHYCILLEFIIIMGLSGWVQHSMCEAMGSILGIAKEKKRKWLLWWLPKGDLQNSIIIPCTFFSRDSAPRKRFLFIHSFFPSTPSLLPSFPPFSLFYYSILFIILIFKLPQIWPASSADSYVLLTWPHHSLSFSFVS
jgi:hypothetical protein